MSEQSRAGGATYRSDVYDAEVHPALFQDILSKRLLAFAIDAMIVVVATIPTFIVVLVLGLLTFGLGWILLPFVFAFVALTYLAITLGGADSVTVGMRAVGIEMRTLGGERMYPLLAILHGLVFWVLVSVLTPLVLIVGLLSNRNRLLHDMLLGTVMLNAEPLRELEQLRAG